MSRMTMSGSCDITDVCLGCKEFSLWQTEVFFSQTPYISLPYLHQHMTLHSISSLSKPYRFLSLPPRPVFRPISHASDFGEFADRYLQLRHLATTPPR